MGFKHYFHKATPFRRKKAQFVSALWKFFMGFIEQNNAPLFWSKCPTCDRMQICCRGKGGDFLFHQPVKGFRRFRGRRGVVCPLRPEAVGLYRKGRIRGSTHEGAQRVRAFDRFLYRAEDLKDASHERVEGILCRMARAFYQGIEEMGIWRGGWPI